MERRPISLALKLLAGLMVLFLLAPVLIVVPMSLSGDAYMAFPPSSWGTRWYGAVFKDVRIADSFFVSLWLALAVTLLSMLIAVPAAYALVRLKPAGTDWLLALFTAPLLLPTIVLGLGLLMVFAPIGLLGSVRGLLFCHMVVTLPYALRVLVTALSTLSPAIEEAAATLGAPPAVVLFRITLPMMTPGIVAASVLSFLVSFDEVVVSLFMTGPNLSTLPVAMFHHVEERADPMVAALSVLLVGLTLVVMLVVDRTIGLGKAFVK